MYNSTCFYVFLVDLIQRACLLLRPWLLAKAYDVSTLLLLFGCSKVVQQSPTELSAGSVNRLPSCATYYSKIFKIQFRKCLQFSSFFENFIMSSTSVQLLRQCNVIVAFHGSDQWQVVLRVLFRHVTLSTNRIQIFPPYQDKAENHKLRCCDITETSAIQCKETD